MMGIERFPSAKKDLRRAILHKDRGFAVRLTPNGSRSHVRGATLDTDCLAASIPNSSQAFILVEREHLEERIQISDTESSITISEEAAIRAIEMIDTQIPVKRLGTTQDLAYLSMFLIDQASSFINGSNYIIDGGLTASS